METLINRVRDDIHHSFSLTDRWFDQDIRILDYLPVDGGWTGFQILEHVTLTNHYLLLLIEKGTSKALRKAATANTAADSIDYDLDRRQLLEVGVLGSFAWVRPAHMEPKGTLSLGEIRVRLREQERTCLHCVERLKNGEGVLYKIRMSVNDLGKLNLYEYIEFLTLHLRRHVAQLESNRMEYLMKIN